MKVLISHDGSLAHYFERLGLARAFVACGHTAVMWEIGKKSAYDAFDDLEPDIFIGQTYNLNEAVASCILERPSLKVYMKAADWGLMTPRIASKYPILVATDKEKELVLRLKEQCNKPDFVFVHHHKDWLNDTHGLWEHAGIKTVSVMNAADVFDYTKGVKQKKYECQIGYVGGYWPFKAQIIDKWFLPLCSDFKYKIKIFGNQGWSGIPQYLGFIENNQVKHFFASSDINLSFSEPHSHHYGYDVTEKFAKVISNKSFLISDYVEGLNKMFTQDEIVLCKTPEEMWSKIDYFLTNPNEKIDIVENGYKKVISNHTYFDRVFQVFIELNLTDEAEQYIKKKKEVFSKLGL